VTLCDGVLNLIRYYFFRFKKIIFFRVLFKKIDYHTKKKYLRNDIFSPKFQIKKEFSLFSEHFMKWFKNTLLRF